MPTPTPKHPPVKLTKGYIDRIKPGPKDEFHWDTDAKGFGLRCTPTRKLTFVVQGRVEGTTGSAARITVGPYGVFTVEQARDVAREHLRSMRMGIDPRAVQKQAEAEGVTLKQVYDSYVSRPGKLKDSTRQWYEFYVTKVFADWQHRPVVEITRDMVRERHAKLMAEGLPGKKRKGGAPASANSAMTVLRILLNYAADEHELADGTPLIPVNPVRAMKRHWAPAGDRSEWYIPFDRVGAVWNMLHEARVSARNRDIEAGVNWALFLMLTGARRSEAKVLTWDRVHLDDDPTKSWWHLIDRKRGKPITLPLSSQAAEVLRACKRVDGNPHVFPSRGRNGHVEDPRSTLAKVDEVAGRAVGAHGLRKTLTNVSEREFRVEHFRTKLLVGHAVENNDVTARHYLDLTDLRWLQPEVQQFGDWVEQQGRIAAGANVVALRA